MNPADDRPDRPLADYADALRAGDTPTTTPLAELPGDFRTDAEDACTVVRKLQAELGPGAPPHLGEPLTAYFGAGLAGERFALGKRDPFSKPDNKTRPGSARASPEICVPEKRIASPRQQGYAVWCL